MIHYPISHQVTHFDILLGISNSSYYTCTMTVSIRTFLLYFTLLLYAAVYHFFNKITPFDVFLGIITQRKSCFHLILNYDIFHTQVSAFSHPVIIYRHISFLQPMHQKNATKMISDNGIMTQNQSPWYRFYFHLGLRHSVSQISRKYLSFRELSITTDCFSLFTEDW